MVSQLMRGLVGLLIAGLLVAFLRQFDYDPFAAGAWVVNSVWDTISHVADMWESNDTFREVTKEPKN